MDKYCIKCKSLIPRKANVSARDWLVRKYCSIDCKREKPIESDHICTCCGEKIIKRENENLYRFNRRKYCSQNCYKKDYRSKHNTWWGHHTILFTENTEGQEVNL